jgi:hypothetical protein
MNTHIFRYKEIDIFLKKVEVLKNKFIELFLILIKKYSVSINYNFSIDY